MDGSQTKMEALSAEVLRIEEVMAGSYAVSCPPPLGDTYEEVPGPWVPPLGGGAPGEFGGLFSRFGVV